MFAKKQHRRCVVFKFTSSQWVFARRWYWERRSWRAQQRKRAKNPISVSSKFNKCNAHLSNFEEEEEEDRISSDGARRQHQVGQSASRWSNSSISVCVCPSHSGACETHSGQLHHKHDQLCVQLMGFDTFIWLVRRISKQHLGDFTHSWTKSFDHHEDRDSSDDQSNAKQTDGICILICKWANESVRSDRIGSMQVFSPQ